MCANYPKNITTIHAISQFGTIIQQRYPIVSNLYDGYIYIYLYNHIYITYIYICIAGVSPWVSILIHDLLTWMIWGTPFSDNPNTKYKKCETASQFLMSPPPTFTIALAPSWLKWIFSQSAMWWSLPKICSSLKGAKRNFVHRDCRAGMILPGSWYHGWLNGWPLTAKQYLTSIEKSVSHIISFVETANDQSL